jgi:hypothetical protein
MPGLLPQRQDPQNEYFLKIIQGNVQEVFNDLVNFADQPWAREIIQLAGLKEPTKFFENIGVISRYEWASKVIMRIGLDFPTDFLSSDLSTIANTLTPESFKRLIDNANTDTVHQFIAKNHERLSTPVLTLLAECVYDNILPAAIENGSFKALQPFIAPDRLRAVIMDNIRPVAQRYMTSKGATEQWLKDPHEQCKAIINLLALSPNVKEQTTGFILLNMESKDQAPEVSALEALFSSGTINQNEAIAAIRSPITAIQTFLKFLDGKTPLFDAFNNVALRFIHHLNKLHDATDKVRFAGVEKLSARELALVMVEGSEELYTSTCRKLFDRFADKVRNEKTEVEALLSSLPTASVRILILEAATFGKLDTVLKLFPSEEQKTGLLSSLFRNLEKGATEEAILANGVLAAELLGKISSPQMKEPILRVINEELLRIGPKGDPLGVKMYTLLKFKLDPESTPNVKQPSREVLETKSVFNEQNISLQRYFFYDDDDGKSSFQHFLGTYKQDKSWTIKECDNFIEIEKTNNGRTIRIFANRPQSTSVGNEQIDQQLQEQPVAVISHRGHSFHIDQTLAQIKPETTLVNLGGCGGSSQLLEVLRSAPNAHVIATRGEGTMLVNDPLFKSLNEELLSKDSIVWSDFWNAHEKQFKNEPRFKDYQNPEKNTAVLFLAALLDFIAK